MCKPKLDPKLIFRRPFSGTINENPKHVSPGVAQVLMMFLWGRFWVGTRPELRNTGHILGETARSDIKLEYVETSAVE